MSKSIADVYNRCSRPSGMPGFANNAVLIFRGIFANNAVLIFRGIQNRFQLFAREPR